MRSAVLAEWIIGRDTTEGRAVSIVGDLIETLPEKGILWFWLAVAKIVLSLIRRRSLAFVVAYFVGWPAFFGFQMAIWGAHYPHRPPHQWNQLFAWLGVSGSVLCALLPYVAIRFGLRDRLTQLTFASVVLIAATIWLWWLPAVLATCIGLSTVVVLVSAATREGRKAWSALLVSIAAAFGSGLAAMYLVWAYQRLICCTLMTSADLRAHPSIQWIGLIATVLILWSAAAACTWMHGRAGRGTPFDSGAEAQTADL